MGYKLAKELNSGKKSPQKSVKFSPKKHGSVSISTPSYPKEQSMSSSALKNIIAD
jgi:hypothetical protein